MSGTLRIAVVGPLEFPAGQGGVSTHVEELYSRLAARGHDVTVLCRPADGIEWYRGMRLRPVPTVRARGWERAGYAIGASLVASGGFDVVHVHSYASAGFSFVPRLRGRRVLVTAHRLEYLDEKWGRLGRSVLRASEFTALRSAHAVIAVSRALERHVRDRTRAPVHYVPNGVTTFPPPDPDALERLGLAGRRYALLVGRLVPEKGVHVAIDAFARLGDEGLDLAIAGAERHSAAYVRALKERNVPGVRFVGAQPRDALASLYAGARALIAPALHEGFGLTLVEAMHFGCPVVASDIEAHREVLGGSGALFAPGDASALAAALTPLLRDDEVVRALGEAGRRRTGPGSEYDWDRVAQRTHEILLSVRGSGAIPEH